MFLETFILLAAADIDYLMINKWKQWKKERKNKWEKLYTKLNDLSPLILFDNDSWIVEERATNKTNFEISK